LFFVRAKGRGNSKQKSLLVQGTDKHLIKIGGEGAQSQAEAIHQQLCGGKSDFRYKSKANRESKLIAFLERGRRFTCKGGAKKFGGVKSQGVEKTQNTEGRD